jgi:glycosyltransferase involved in cell wall biosynthesis
MAELGTPLAVGVAVPVFNGEQFLAETLRSVLAQSYPVSDIVVLDDGSDDSSGEVAERCGSPVRVVRRPHVGIGAARSDAMRLVRGEVIMPLDADDLLTADSVECRVRAFAAMPELELVFGQVRHFSECAAGVPVALDRPQAAHVPGGMLIRRASYECVGGFATGLRVAEALDWLLRAREVGLRELTVPEQVLWRRVHGGNNSVTQREALTEFPRALKASLDRRRAGGR